MAVSVVQSASVPDTATTYDSYTIYPNVPTLPNYDSGYPLGGAIVAGDVLYVLVTCPVVDETPSAVDHITDTGGATWTQLQAYIDLTDNFTAELWQGVGTTGGAALTWSVTVFMSTGAEAGALLIDVRGNNTTHPTESSNIISYNGDEPDPAPAPSISPLHTTSLVLNAICCGAAGANSGAPWTVLPGKPCVSTHDHYVEINGSWQIGTLTPGVDSWATPDDDPGFGATFAWAVAAPGGAVVNSDFLAFM